MRDPFRNYDAWLEAPFQRMCEEQDRIAQLVDEAIEAGELPPDPSDEVGCLLLESAGRDGRGGRVRGGIR